MKPKAIRSILALVFVLGLLLAVAPAALAASPIVYDAIPALLPPSMPSQPFQAQQTYEFGDWVQLAGTNRELRTVTVTMVTWADYAPYAANPSYNPASWSHPITLNIYNFVPGTPLNTKGTLLGTVTQMVTIPWRPVADPTCPTPTAWRFDPTHCYNGFAFNITLDMSSLNLTLPNDIIVGIAYNTMTYGVAPIGVTGPYDSLNVGVVGSATVGTDGNTDRVFWNTITAAWYTDGGAGGVGIFREDTGWGAPNAYGTVPIQITAAPVPSDVYVNPAWASVPPGQDPDGAGPAIQMGYDAFTTIQAGVDAVASGGTVNVAAATYAENVNVDKHVSIIGAGSGTGGTVISSAGGGTGGVVQLSASGASASQPVQLRGLRIQPTGMAGISVGQFGQTTGTNVSFVELYDVQVVGTNTNPCTEQERGLYVDLTSSLTNLKVINSAFNNLAYGWYLQKKVDVDTSTVQYVDVRNTTFNHNNLKGIYAEKLEDATFKNVTASQNGYDASLLTGCPYFAPWMSGFDINLKGGAYQNLTFINNTITNNGLGGAKEGVGIAVKARDDGATYGAFPATLSNVSIESSLVAGNERGIRFGEPGKSNAGPTGVTVHNACISGNVQTYIGSDGSAYGGLVNASLATVDATNNWWGNASGPAPTGTGDAAVAAPGLVTVSPWNTVGCPLPELSAKTGDALFCVGEQTTVTLDLARIAGLYGYQFEVSYNKDMASAVGAFVNTFFNTTVNAFSDPGWGANCTATPGTCKFSVVKTDPGAPVSGSGTLAQIVFTVAPGAFNVTVGSDATVTDRDGELLYRILAAPLPLTVCGSTTVSGKITLQGRSSGNINPGTVTLTDLGGNFLPASTSFSAADGAFTLNVPVMPTGSNYQIDAAHGLYLTNRKTPVALTYGVPLDDQDTRLWGGDANNDGFVKVADLSCIGGSFGATPPGTCTGGSADINADGKVNVQDLAIAGGNFDKCGAQPWDWVHGTPVTCP